MKVSVLRESKTDSSGQITENRVILTPQLVKQLKQAQPNVSILVESQAGQKIGYSDKDYKEAGAEIVNHTEALKADLVLGVKETESRDFQHLENNIVMSFQHFAASKTNAQKAIESGATFICLETIQSGKTFPCLAPMSEAAARIIARHADMFALLKHRIISSGQSQTSFKRLKVTILGAGNVGRTAAKEFAARGMEVHLIDKQNLGKLEKSIQGSFFTVSAMYTAGRSPEKLITKDLLNKMAAGGCVYPVDIDQGGGVEGTVETSVLNLFDLPKISGTRIYCFAPPNIPSLGAKTTSEALGFAIIPYVLEITKKGLEKAAKENPAVQSGINIQNGKITHPGLASSIQIKSS